MSGPTPRDGIMDIRPYKPGSSEAPGVARPAKLSSNENPLGASPKAIEAYKACADSLHLYPDGGWIALREAIAARYDPDAERLVCGAGSDEILQMLGKAYLNPGDSVVRSQYGFLVYDLVAKQNVARIRVAAEPELRCDVQAMLDQVTSDTKLVFIANPNNPTGTYISGDEIRALHAGLPEHVLLVVDEAYAEYMRADDYETALPLAESAPNVIVTRTFSKIYGMAALRLGWAYGPEAVIGALNRVRGPFNVTSPAQAAGAAAIQDLAFEERSVAHNAQWLSWIEAKVREAGFSVTPSVGNFTLIHFDAEGLRTAQAADAFLKSKGLILRAVGAYGLPNCLRLSIGTGEECERVAAALQEFASGS